MIIDLSNGRLTEIQAYATKYDLTESFNKTFTRFETFSQCGVEKDLIGLELKLKDFKADRSPYKEYINQTVPMFENIVEYYRKSDGATKKKILSCIFSKKIVLEKGKVATCEFTTPVQVLFNASKGFEGLT